MYGTATNGGYINKYACGATGCGVAFELDASGKESVITFFVGTPEGTNPTAGVVLDSTGNIYGTSPGGFAGAGTIFKGFPQAPNGGLVLYTFQGGTDGKTPQAGVIRAASGNLYGTTVDGGANGAGVIYELNSRFTQSVLVNFCANVNCTDGANPKAGLTRDSAGNFYTTTYGGGAHGQGEVLELELKATAPTILHSFTGGADGGQPVAGVIRDSQGNLYGTTSTGGNLSGVCGALGGCGVVFKLDTSGVLTPLHAFTGGADGATPYGRLLLARGKLYGTTVSGGDLSGCGGAGCGVVFVVDPATAKERPLHRFTGGADGANPYVGVIADGSGNLYGTAAYGGDLTSTLPSCAGKGCGVVFKLTP